MAPYQLASKDPAENPALHSWHHVFVPYCSSDLHSGQVSAPSNETFGLWFAGHNILKAIVSDLNSTAGLDTASTVVLSGASAGGIGTWINVDWLQETLPSAKVYGAPIAGFYAFGTFYEGAGHTTPPWPFDAQAWPKYAQLWSSFLPQACAKALGSNAPWCLISNFSAPHVAAPMFVTEAQTDAVQLMMHDGVPWWAAYGKVNATNAFLLEWKQNQTMQMKDTLKPGDGWFNPACFIHTEFSHTAPLIQGKSYSQAFAEWFAGGKPTVRLMDDCGILCNRQCK